MANFPPDRYNFDAVYVLNNGYYVDFKIIGPKKAAITKTPEGAVWFEGNPSFSTPAEVLVNEAVTNLSSQFGDAEIEVIEIIQKQVPPPPKKNIQFELIGKIKDPNGEPVKSAQVKPTLFEFPSPPPNTLPDADSAADTQTYTDFENTNFTIGPALIIAPISVDENGNFSFTYEGEVEIDFSKSYIEVTAPNFFPKTVGPNITKTGEKSVEKSSAGGSIQNDNNTVSYRYITGFTFDNNGNASGIEVIVENNADLPDFTKNFSSTTFTPESAKTQVKNMMDAAGDYVNGVKYPKTGTSLNADLQAQDPPPEKENIIIDIYDLGKITIQSELAELEKEEAQLLIQVQNEENKIIENFGKQQLGFEIKLTKTFAQQKERLKLRILPKILSVIASFGPAIVNSIITNKVNALDDTVCPDPEKIKWAIQQRNKLVKDLNRAYKIVRAVSKILKVTNALIIGLKVGLTVLQALSAVPGPVKPPFFGIKDLYSGLMEKGFKITDKTLEKAGIAVTVLNILAATIGAVLGAIIDLLNKLDFMLQKCAEKPAPVLDPVTGEMVVKPIPFEVINAELNSYVDAATGETEDIIDPLTDEPLPYKGFTFEIKTDTSQDFQYPKRYAIARNVQGIQVLRSESSFASSPEILIEELKFVIDRDNLRAD